MTSMDTDLRTNNLRSLTKEVMERRDLSFLSGGGCRDMGLFMTKKEEE